MLQLRRAIRAIELKRGDSKVDCSVEALVSGVHTAAFKSVVSRYAYELQHLRLIDCILNDDKESASRSVAGC